MTYEEAKKFMQDHYIMLDIVHNNVMIIVHQDVNNYIKKVLQDLFVIDKGFTPKDEIDFLVVLNAEEHRIVALDGMRIIFKKNGFKEATDCEAKEVLQQYSEECRLA